MKRSICPTMRSFGAGAAALLAAMAALVPEDASAYWRGRGWGYVGWGGYYRPIYAPPVYAPVVAYPVAYGYPMPYPVYGGYYGDGYPHGFRCKTDEGYGRRGSCDR